MSYQVIVGDCRESLKALPAESVHCCVSSPPYWNLRDYECDGQIGLEPTMAVYIDTIVAVFAEVRRVLRRDGTLWLNLGDSYMSGGNGARDPELWPKQSRNAGGFRVVHGKRPSEGLKPKDLILLPHRVAIALQEDGWWVRSTCVWVKPNAMPESVRDRPSTCHEYVFLLSRSRRYYYDAEAVTEAVTGNTHGRGRGDNPKAHKVPAGWDTGDGAHTKLTGRYRQNPSFSAAVAGPVTERNLRTAWTIPTQQGPDTHFATFPERLAEIPILAGTSEYGCCGECGAPWERATKVSYDNPGNRRSNGPRSAERRHIAYAPARVAKRLERRTETVGWQPTCKHEGGVVPCTVLDPFAGSGTTLAVALKHRRHALGLELNPEYAQLLHDRCASVQQTLPIEAAV